MWGVRGADKPFRGRVGVAIMVTRERWGNWVRIKSKGESDRARVHREREGR
jgi:hypothetical protein